MKNFFIGCLSACGLLFSKKEPEKNAFIFQNSDLPFWFIEYNGQLYYTEKLTHIKNNSDKN